MYSKIKNAVSEAHGVGIRAAAAAFAMSLVLAVPAFAGTWRQGTGSNSGRWWYDNGSGSCTKNAWQWIDGNGDGQAECYYFDDAGWLLTDTAAPDGQLVNRDGARMKGTAVETMPVSAAEGTIESALTAADDASGSSASDTAAESSGSAGRLSGMISYLGPAGFTEAESVQSNASSSAIVNAARTHLGALPYVSGGNSFSGTDCSGFTKLIYAGTAGITLPRTSREQYAAGIKLTKEQVRPGDLVFFSDDGTADGIYHVGIYSGTGTFIHETNSSRNVCAEDSISNMGKEAFGYVRYTGTYTS